MTTNAKHRDNYVDALERQLQYAVLTKTGRVQILVQPTVKELRKRGKRGWHLFAGVDPAVDAEGTLLDLVRRALAETETSADAAAIEKPKAKKAKSRPPKTAAL